MIEATPAFGGLLNLNIGWNAETDAKISVEFNRQTNNYLAVTGKPGSGKTQFVKDLLAQIRLQSDFKVNFVFFDYAKGDVADDADFVSAARKLCVCRKRVCPLIRFRASTSIRKPPSKSPRRNLRI